MNALQFVLVALWFVIFALGLIWLRTYGKLKYKQGYWKGRLDENAYHEEEMCKLVDALNHSKITKVPKREG